MGSTTPVLSRFEMGRVGVIDVGSNSVRLVVFDGAARSPAYFYNEKVLCGLGKGVSQTGRLNPQGRELAHAALRRFTKLAELMKLNALMGVATAAVREAEDGPEFCDQVEAETGLRLKVATGREEARLSAQGVFIGWHDAVGLVCDIGGSSMELARLHGGQIGTCETSSLAPLALQDIEDAGGDVEAFISRTLGNLRAVFPGNVEKLFLVGGSWRAIANLHMSRTNYPLRVLHEYEVAPEDLAQTIEWVAASSPEELSKHTDTSMARLAVTPMAARVLAQLIPVFTPGVIAISAYGLREGVLYEHMPEDLRSADPLLEGCGYLERRSARFPGFGGTLFEWLQPLLAGRSDDDMRLVHATCMLHDVHWRAMPDYRAAMSVQHATLSGLSGITHAGRVFIGVALSHRYKNGSSVRPEQDLRALLSDDQTELAERVGRAIRLGAMLAGAVPEALEHTELSLEDGVLTLTLPQYLSDLMGPPVEKRLTRLAKFLSCEGKICVSA